MYQEFQSAMSTYGPLKYNTKQFEYLGMEMEQLDDHSVKVSMSKMTNKILNRRSIVTTSSNPSSSYLFTNNDGNAEFSANANDFKSKTYELMYLDKIRIDIKKKCNELASLSNIPGDHSYKKLKKVYSFLNEQKMITLFLAQTI